MLRTEAFSSFWNMTSVKMSMKGMKKKVNKAIKRYLKEIRNLLPVYGRKEKAFVMMIKTSILETYGTESTVGYDMICSEFGSPKEIVISYFAEVEDDELYKRVRFSKMIKIAAIFIVLIVAATAVFKSILLYDSYKKSVDAIITQEVTVIE